jgi:hypothetical protein
MTMQQRENRDSRRIEQLMEAMITSEIAIVPSYGIWSLHALPTINIV